MTCQKDLNTVKDWCDLHKLTINVKKTKAILFSGRKDTVYRNITLKNDNIEHVTVFKYLGIHLDTRLGFQTQYKETYKLSSYKLLMLKRVRPFIDEYTALTVLKTMMLPYLDMGNMFFTGLPSAELERLDIILKYWLKVRLWWLGAVLQYPRKCKGFLSSLGIPIRSICI